MSPGTTARRVLFSSTTTATPLENDLIWREELFQESTTTSAAPTHILRPSASAGTLYRQSTIINKRGIGGELLDTCQRHQRDLFSGDLGIPEINTHVGSVVHTFETLAMLRRQQQQQQQMQVDGLNYKFIPATATPSKRSYNGGGAASTNSTSKYNKLKRKSHEYRQKLALANCNYNNNLPLSASFPKISNHQSANHKNSSTMSPEREHVSSSNVYNCSQTTPNLPPFYNNFKDDYRKSQFGTLSSRNNLNLNSQSGTIPHPCDHKDPDLEERVVNDAFEDIFTGYSCCEDEDDDGFPGNRQQSRKGPAPQPPPARKPVPPPKPFKARSTTLTNIFERIKNSNPKRSLSKTPSEGLLKDESQSQPSVLHKYANQMDLHSGTEDGGECPNDFLRGTTISQSFIRNPLRGGIIRENFSLQPPPRPQLPSISTSMPSSPPQKPQRNFIKNNKMSFLTRRSKSSSELLLDDLEVQARKYHQRSSGGADAEQLNHHRNFSSTTTTGCGPGQPLSRGGLEKGDFKRSASQRNSCSFHPRPLDRAEI